MKIKCTHCNKQIERVKKSSTASCFECKTKRKNLYSNTHRAKNTYGDSFSKNHELLMSKYRQKSYPQVLDILQKN